MELPFDGAISQFFDKEAPNEIRKAIKDAGKHDIVAPAYPYDEQWDKDEYNDEMDALQIELVKLQSHVRASGDRIAVIFEGRDAAGKGGTVKRFRQNLNPRNTRVVALPAPSDLEKRQWYFQRYIQHLPAKGEITFFDRSWYNRGVVEQVFDFVTPPERERWFEQVQPFEQMLVDEGIKLFKIWLTVSRAEQLRRFLARERDPLKQWKLSWIDVEGLKRWDEYTDAIEETLQLTHSIKAPWTVILTDDKRRARVAAIKAVLSNLEYEQKKNKVVEAPDPKICGGPELWYNYPR